MIKIFGQTDKTFTSNGDIVISPLKAKVHKKDNSDYYLEIDAGLEYIDYFVEGNIIVANTPTGDQAFRIYNVQKSESKISCKCWHVFYDSKNYLIPSAIISNKNCQQALTSLNNATVPTTEFTVTSNITTQKSLDVVRLSFYNAIENVLATWGGHLVRNNFSIGVQDSIGQDNGIIIQYKKNLKNISVSEDWSSVVTKLLPVGKDGVLLNAVNPSASIYLTSDTQYDIPYTKTVTFSQNINEKDYQTETQYKTALVNDLRSQATTYLNANCVPKVNYTLKANLDRVSDIGDTIEVIDERLDVHIMTSVIGFVYDCISKQYTEVQFGNFTKDLSGLVGKIVKESASVSNQRAEEVKDEIIATMTESYVIYNGDSIEVVNALPKENATRNITIDQSGIKFNNGGLQVAKWDINGDLYLANQKVDDFVFEHGTSNGWEYKKYKSGVVECWKQVTPTITWSAFGSYYKGSFDTDLPYTMEQVFASIDEAPDVAWIGVCNNEKINIVRVGNTGTIKVNIRAYGRAT